MITGVVDDGESGAAMQAADDEKIVFGNQPGREFQFVLAQKVRLIELVPTAAVPDRFQLVGEAGADAGTAQILVLSGHSTEVAAVTTSASFATAARWSFS